MTSEFESQAIDDTPNHKTDSQNN